MSLNLGFYSFLLEVWLIIIIILTNLTVTFYCFFNIQNYHFTKNTELSEFGNDSDFLAWTFFSQYFSVATAENTIRSL